MEKISDGDKSSAFKSVTDMNVYGDDVKIEKLEDLNHAHKLKQENESYCLRSGIPSHITNRFEEEKYLVYTVSGSIQSPPPTRAPFILKIM